MKCEVEYLENFGMAAIHSPYWSFSIMEQRRKAKFPAGSPLSWIIFFSLRDLYFNEVKKVLTTNTSRNKLHGHTTHGITAFPIAGAVWEAIINEHFTSDLVSHDYKNNLLFDIIEEADKWDIKTKTLMFPKFLFGRTFDSSQSLYSDFTSLIQIRNNIVHYKHSLYEGPDKAIRNLRLKKVTYPKPDRCWLSLAHGIILNRVHPFLRKYHFRIR